MAVYLGTIRKYSKARIVLRAHNIEHYIWDRHIRVEQNFLKRAYLSLQNKRLKEFELKIFNEVDAVVPITQADADALPGLGCHRPLQACITGVDVRKYQRPYAGQKKGKTVFYFGSMDWMPNIEAVLWFTEHCWPAIHKAVPEAKFVVAGKNMPAAIKKLDAPNLLLIENGPNSAAFYHQYEVMVVPLWSGSGLRIKIIEGMAYGKAIVSTSIGAEGIPVNPGKDILIANEAESFCAGVISLLTDPERRNELEKSAAAFASATFDNQKVVSGLLDFYNRMLHDKLA